MFILRSKTKKVWSAGEANDGGRFAVNSVYGFMEIKRPLLTGLAMRKQAYDNVEVSESNTKMKRTVKI